MRVPTMSGQDIDRDENPAPPVAPTPPPERRFDLREQFGALTVGDAPGEVRAIKFENAKDMLDFAQGMAKAQTAVPGYLRGNVGDCLAIVIRAYEVGLSPFFVASCSYRTTNPQGEATIGYNATFYNAVILAHAPLRERPEYEYVGEGPDLCCKVLFKLRGETRAREYLSKPLRELHPGYMLNARLESNQASKRFLTYAQAQDMLRQAGGQLPAGQWLVVRGSQLWERKPNVQMSYDAIRDVARLYFPDVLGGQYTGEELEEAHIGPDYARDVSPVQARLASAQQQGVREGFSGSEVVHSVVDAALAAAHDSAAEAATGEPARSRRPKRDGSQKHAPAAEATMPPRASSASSAPLDEAQNAGAGSKPSGAAADQHDQGGAAQQADRQQNSIDAASGTGQPSAASPNSEPPELTEAFHRGQQARRNGLKKRAVPGEYRDNAHSRHAAMWMEGWQDEDDAMAGKQQ